MKKPTLIGRYIMKQKCQKISIALLVSVTMATAKVPFCTFNHLTVFGDNYSDIGNAGPIPDPYCLATENPPFAPDTNPGAKLWDQVVAAALRVPFEPSKDGGTDYAVSLATSAQVLNQSQSYVQLPNAPVCNNLFAAGTLRHA